MGKDIELEIRKKIKASIRESILNEEIHENPPILSPNMDQLKDVEFDEKSLDFDTKNEEVKAKTSLRMTYEAQVEVLKRQLGDLEQIRGNLGLSQRKMAQLLMVDPSSWTRWTKKGDEAPPQVWRALQWYLALQGKIPGLNNQYFLSESSRSLELKNQEQISHLRLGMQDEIQKIKAELKLFKIISIFLALTLGSLFLWVSMQG